MTVVGEEASEDVEALTEAEGALIGAKGALEEAEVALVKEENAGALATGTRATPEEGSEEASVGETEEVVGASGVVEEETEQEVVEASGVAEEEVVEEEGDSREEKRCSLSPTGMRVSLLLVAKKMHSSQRTWWLGRACTERRGYLWRMETTR